ncbi:MAG: large-conductance mechanosensitive channel protein MscL [Planctomycetota bacterium]
MGMLTEFKKFALRGNVVDMAVGTIIGGAFGKIVASLVNDVLMPPLGRIMGGVDFKNLEWVIGSGEKPATLRYGAFLQTVFDFTIVAAAVFMMIQAMNRATEKFKRQEAAAAPPAPTTKECPFCLSVIPLKATRCGHCTSAL